MPIHVVQPNNRSINRFRKRSRSLQKFNADFIHSREMETLLRTNAKFVKARARRIKSNANKLLAREKAESWPICCYRHESFNTFS